MDIKIRARRPIRAMMTRTINLLREELAKGEPVPLDIKTLLVKLRELTDKIATYDEEILEFLLVAEPFDELEYERESQGIEEYQDLARQLRLAAEASLIPQIPQAPNSPPASLISRSDTISSGHRFKLPKIELRKFGGELSEWLGWWAQFEKIHSCDLGEVDKFHYLKQSMKPGSRAEKLVNSYPETKANYQKVITALTDRYGDKSLLAETYIRQLQKVMLDMSNIKVFSDLENMYDNLETQLRSLDSLEVELDKSTFLVPLIEAGLPIELLRVWQRSVESGYDEDKPIKSEARLDALLKFLRREIKGEKRIQLIQTESVEVKPSYSGKPSKGESLGIGLKGCGLRDKKSPPTVFGLTTQSSLICIFCAQGSHNSQDCMKAVDMSHEMKNDKVKASGSCYKCLKRGHSFNKCYAKVKCVLCGRSHYPIMCRQNKNESRKGEPNKSNAEPAVVNSCNESGGVVLMKTILVNVKSNCTNKKDMTVRLLFDEGSNYSYIKTTTATTLNYPVVDELYMTTTVFGGVTTSTQRKSKYKIQLKKQDNSHREVVYLIGQEKICGVCPKVPKGDWLSELRERGIYINDTLGTESTDIAVLIGSDLWAQFMTGRMYKLRCGLIAVESVFGWTLSGRLPTKETTVANNVIAMSVRSENLSNLWKLETLGICDPVEQVSKDAHDLLVKEQVQKNAYREPDGRYVVKLPWVDRNLQLTVPTNKAVAYKRLKSTIDRLEKSQNLPSYNQIFQDWISEGIVETHTEQGSKEHFLPHRPVFKPTSITTPVRPVFDASCHLRNQPSLNHCLEKGPNLLEMIPALVLRFRMKKYGVIADIRKAFQMIGVSEEDRNFQKFLWQNGGETVVFRHCRVVFGMNCSPFLLAAVLDLHLMQVSENLKNTAMLVKKSLYVDNLVLSLDSREEYHRIKKEAIEILDQAKMNLRQWESNADDQQAEVKSMVLGLWWDKEGDELYCQTPKFQATEISKRTVLSITAQIFDPLGIVGPAVLQLKMMLQGAWVKNLGWDDPWDELSRQKVLRWVGELAELEKIRVPRWVFDSVGTNNLQFHVFTDASQEAYAAIVFLRVETGSQVSIQLLMAKSRLAPLAQSRKITIPRLELMGCLIGSRLVNEVMKALSFTNVPLFCWSDSTTALAWIRRDDQWGTFVHNRTREINGLVPKASWRHVPGEMNPADLPSRGCTLSELVISKWWEGPAWLKQHHMWPKMEGAVNEELVVVEKRKTAVVNVGNGLQNVRFSEYWKNVKVYAWVDRFVNNLKKKETDRERSTLLTVNEMQRGELKLLSILQGDNFAKVPQNKLTVVRGEDGLIRVKTRLAYRLDNESFKYPILLPGNAVLVRQLIEFVHKFFCHAGTQFVLQKLRERYWITQGRKSVGSVINKCVICRRFSAKRFESRPAPLPMERTDISWAFKTTGVDLAGPLFLKGGEKVWIVIFTCAVYRGVHLDLVDSLTAGEFLCSLKRFCCTVGRPSVMFSDNGTNFVGSVSLIKSLNWEEIKEQSDVNQIKWKFNPPTAAWWGGWWERLIRTLKDLLRRMIGRAKLLRQELVNCLCEITYVMNERPLTVSNEDPEDFTPLTPAMFMRDLPISGLPEFNLIVAKDLQGAHRKLLAIKEALKARFRKEYLANLVMRGGKNSKLSPEVGQVVLVGSDNHKRFEWPLGRIVAFLPGKDGEVRLCKVQTKQGVILRPVQRLYPLEVEPQQIPQDVESQQSSKGLGELSEDTDIGDGSELGDYECELQEGETEVKVPGGVGPILTTRSGRRVRSPYYSTWK